VAVEETWALQNAAINAVTFRQALASLLTPAGGVSTVRGIGWLMSHSSTLTITQQTMRAPSGSVSRDRPAIGE